LADENADETYITQMIMDSFMGKQQTSRVVEVCTAQRQINRLSEACNQCMHVSTVRDN